MFQTNDQNYFGQNIEDNLLSNLELSEMETETHHICTNESTTAETLLQLGILYWRRGNFDRSEKLLTKARDYFSDHQDIIFLAHCFIGLALVKTSLEKDDDAINAYKQAIELSPKNFHLWNNLASLYLKKDQLEQAIFAFKNAIKINPGDAVAWNGLANIYYQNKNIEEAIKAYKRTIALLPEIDIENPNCNNRHPEVNKLFILPRLRLAALYAKKCQYLNAIEMYKKALTLDIDNAEIWNKLGALYLKVEAYEESLNALSKAIELNPEYGEAYLNLACSYAISDRAQDSLPLFIKSLETLPNQHDRELASRLMEKAISDIKENNELNTNKKEKETRFDSFLGNITWFYYKYEEEITSMCLSSPPDEHENAAAKSSNKLINKDACDLIVEMNAQQSKKGERTMLGQFPTSLMKQLYAKTDTKSGEEQDTTTGISDPSLWNEKGNIHFNSKDYREAIISYNNAIEIDPTFGKAYHNLALIHFIRGHYDEAIMLYQESINLLISDHEKAIAWNGLGNAYRCKKDYESALIAYQRASEMDKENGGVADKQIVFEVSEKQRTADFWNDLGKLFYKTGAYEKAVNAFQKAIELEPSSGKTYSHLARVLTAQGQYKKAISLYRKSIDLISNEKERTNAWNRLGDVYRKLNDYDNALKAYQKATSLTDDKLSLLDRARLSLLSNCTAK